jgi:hypothetical protein
MQWADGGISGGTTFIPVVPITTAFDRTSPLQNAHVLLVATLRNSVRTQQYKDYGTLLLLTDTLLRREYYEYQVLTLLYIKLSCA